MSTFHCKYKLMHVRECLDGVAENRQAKKLGNLIAYG